MTSLKILSGGAAQGLVGSLAAKFKEHTGLDIAGDFGAVGAMADKLRGGMPADILILTSALTATLAREGLVADNARLRMSAASRPRWPFATPIRWSRR